MHNEYNKPGIEILKRRYFHSLIFWPRVQYLINPRFEFKHQSVTSLITRGIITGSTLLLF